MPFIITVDGPSGSGKGTIASLLAKHYGYHFLDSGALYRLIGLAANHAGLFNQDILDIHRLVEIVDSAKIEFNPSDKGDALIFLNNHDVTQTIRTEQVGAFASKVATIAEVRQALLQRQQDFVQQPGLVADGRDMGTVVFPDAPAKIYLTATVEARAERRVKQLQGMDVNVKIDAILADLQARDQRDMEREVAPLKPSADAMVIDSSALTINQVLDLLISFIDSKRVNPG